MVENEPEMAVEDYNENFSKVLEEADCVVVNMRRARKVAQLQHSNTNP